MYGAIAGDIVGSIYEFNPTKTTDFPLLTPQSHFTDDSVMTTAIADALTKLPEDVDERIAKMCMIDKMQEYGRKYPDAGYGGMFRQWLRMENPAPYNSYGNGSAMRVSSVGWIYSTLEKTREVAKWSAEITHNHPEGIKGARAVAEAIFLARCKYTKKQIQREIEKNYYPGRFDKPVSEIRRTYEFDETCQGSVPEAMQCFFESTDFESAIRLAVSLGGDSDTQAAIAGSIAEAYYMSQSDVPASICEGWDQEEESETADVVENMRIPESFVGIKWDVFMRSMTVEIQSPKPKLFTRL